ncbi:MAG: hypothetical protein K2K14_04880 [Ruminococcus sp.]|nr:hypothetical protein [Ruminococcus sp.]
MNKKDFRQYMLCGHGRCFSATPDELENFREIVLHGCLNDISFDLQCEGSRGLFMYNLALQYEDYNYFLKPAIEKFLSPEVCDDWHLINHLADFIDYFADDYGDKSAQKAIAEKYKQLYRLLMSLRWSSRANKVSQCYEYISIILMQKSTIDRAIKIFGDMGNFFIRRRRASDDRLKGEFLWFWHCTLEKYDEKYLSEKLDIISKNNAGIRRFRRVMFHKEDERIIKRKNMSADEFIELAENQSVQRKDVIALRRAESSEKMKVAQAVVSESNPDKKAELLKAFTISKNPFPLDPEILTEYALSDNRKLSETAVEVLLYDIKADCVHDFAVKLLEKSFSPNAMRILLNNYRDSDKEFIIDKLNSIEVDRDDESGWHRIVMGINDNIQQMPEEAVMFVYERSMCSCCRENAVSELIRRNLFTEEIRSECLMDCNFDIHKEAENYERKI